MQKVAYSRSVKGIIARIFGLSFLSAFIFTITVAIRHLLETPMKLESPLPGETHYYKWKHGYIFYKVLGESKSPSLLLLHSPGLAASSYEMRLILEPLAQQYRVYAPDLIGFGISDHPKIAYSSEVYNELCHDFLTDIVKQPATIVASQMSCNYAVATAAKYPNLCERLVLLSPQSLEDKQEQTSLTPMSISKNFFVKAWHVLLQEAPVQLLLYPLLSTRFALQSLMAQYHSSINENDLEYFYAAAHQSGAERAAMAFLGGKLELDVSQQLELLQQPTLVIWGAKGLNSSRHIGSQQDISWMKSQTRLALLPDAGLAVHEEQPMKVSATILSWSEEGKDSNSSSRDYHNRSLLCQMQNKKKDVKCSRSNLQRWTSGRSWHM